MSTEVVYNNGRNYVSLSDKALARYNELSGKQCRCIDEILRHCPHLVKVVKEMGDEANNGGSCLTIFVVDDDRYLIVTLDCIERVITPNSPGWIKIMPTEVVYNTGRNWPRLSDKALARYNELSGKQCRDIDEILRHCPHLLKVFKEMGDEANVYGSWLTTKIVDANQYLIARFADIERVITLNSRGWITIRD